LDVSRDLIEGEFSLILHHRAVFLLLITVSALATTLGGIVNPICLAVLRLIPKTPNLQGSKKCRNAVVWKSVFQSYAVIAKSVSFWALPGKLQVEDGVAHLFAQEF